MPVRLYCSAHGLLGFMFHLLPLNSWQLISYHLLPWFIPYPQLAVHTPHKCSYAIRGHIGVMIMFRFCLELYILHITASVLHVQCFIWRCHQQEKTALIIQCKNITMNVSALGFIPPRHYVYYRLDSLGCLCILESVELIGKPPISLIRFPWYPLLCLLLYFPYTCTPSHCLQLLVSSVFRWAAIPKLERSEPLCCSIYLSCHVRSVKRCIRL